MIRLSPQLRAGIQRSTLPALILLSAGIVLIGKTDQTMFERFRTGLSDAAAPVCMAINVVAVRRQVFGGRDGNRRAAVQRDNRLHQALAVGLRADEDADPNHFGYGAYCFSIRKQRLITSRTRREPISDDPSSSPT